MLKNLKIDIIYYNTPSDFEFEFNLGGYCRSRILNSKANDLRETLTKLAIAVSRSRVIIIIGEMLGNNGSIAPVAKAISKPLVSVDHHQYHITTPEPINIIEGSLPLVNSNGEFGGCIIESGPQSIVFLSNDKQIRNSIEKELLSHYLTSLSMTSDEENEIINEAETVKSEEEINSVTEQEAIEENSLENEDVLLSEEDANSPDEQEDIISIPDTEEPDSPCEEKDSVSEDVNSNEITITDDESIPENTVSEENEDKIIISPEEPTAILDEFDDFDNDFSSDDYEDEFAEEKAPKRPLSSLSKALIVLSAVLFIVIAAILYFTLYLPSLDGISFFEFIDSVFSITKILYL